MHTFHELLRLKISFINSNCSEVGIIDNRLANNWNLHICLQVLVTEIYNYRQSHLHFNLLLYESEDRISISSCPLRFEFSELVLTSNGLKHQNPNTHIMRKLSEFSFWKLWLFSISYNASLKIIYFFFNDKYSYIHTHLKLWPHF